MFDANHIVQTGGLLAVALMIFAESGLLVGIILPGDSLLLAAGVFAGQGKLPIFWLISLSIIAAILGYEVGYSIGQRIGPRMFKRDDGFLFREEYITKTQKFFDKYGPATLVGARFIANVRTIVSAVAGAGGMNRTRYFIYNAVGAVLWVTSLSLLGYWLGANVPNIDKLILPALIIGLAVLYAFAVWHLMRTPERRAKLRRGLREDWNYFFRSGKNS